MAFLTEENGNIVAMSSICFYKSCPKLYNLYGKRALITDMYTLPDYRSKGLGSKLLKSILNYAKDLGYSTVTLNTTDSGRRLYEKYGFKEVRGEMVYKFK